MVKKVKIVPVPRSSRTSERPYRKRHRTEPYWTDCSIEYELKETAEFFGRSYDENRQHELIRLVDEILEKKGAYQKLSDKARGFVCAAVKNLNLGFAVPEPNDHDWLHPTTQRICGAPTMKLFLEMTEKYGLTPDDLDEYESKTWLHGAK